MSSPDTNKKKDAKRHRGPLLGLLGVVLFALLLLGILSIYVSSRGNEPGDGESIGEETISPAVQGDSTSVPDVEVE